MKATSRVVACRGKEQTEKRRGLERSASTELGDSAADSEREGRTHSHTIRFITDIPRRFHKNEFSLTYLGMLREQPQACPLTPPISPEAGKISTWRNSLLANDNQ